MNAISIAIVDRAIADDTCKNVPNHDSALRARQSADRAAERIARHAAMTAAEKRRAERHMKRDAQRAAGWNETRANDTEDIAWLLYSAKLTD